jgi:hypothetical protein
MQLTRFHTLLWLGAGLLAVLGAALLARTELLPPSGDTQRSESRLPSVFPQVSQAQHRQAGEAWPRASLAELLK